MTTDTETPKPPVLPLVYFPDATLQQVSKKVSFEPGDGGVWVDGLKGFSADLVATMQHNNGVGLSAVQVGNPIRVIVVGGEGLDTPIVMVNPRWSAGEGAVMAPASEGCLSFPALFEDVERWNIVCAVWQDVDGKEQAGVFTGVQAQVIQHECEHLEGKLLIEHLPVHKRERVRQKMKQRARLTAKVDKLMRGGGGIQALINSGVIRVGGPRKGFRSIT